MKFEELKKYSHIKILIRGKSGRGKTRTACHIALAVANEGKDVLYVDTEAEGATNMVALIEANEFPKEATKTLEYEQVSGYDEFFSYISHETQKDYDLVVIDTLDHKHSFVLKAVTDAKLEADADWNQYPRIYSKEKDVMETIGQPETNIVATLDPDSGSNQKPKGAQTNIHGYFSAVIDLTKNGDKFDNIIRNFVGKGDKIGKSAKNLEPKLAEEVLERTE